MKKPRERRTPMKLPVRVWGMDSAGRLFSIEASTLDITPRGAIIGVECGRSRARFRIAWVGTPGSDRDGQIGVQCIEPGKYIWGVPLLRAMDNDDGAPQLLEEPLVTH